MGRREVDAGRVAGAPVAPKEAHLGVFSPEDDTRPEVCNMPTQKAYLNTRIRRTQDTRRAAGAPARQTKPICLLFGLITGPGPPNNANRRRLWAGDARWQGRKSPERRWRQTKPIRCVCGGGSESRPRCRAISSPSARYKRTSFVGINPSVSGVELSSMTTSWPSFQATFLTQ